MGILSRNRGGGGGGAGGLNTTQVRALIADWAETGQPIPAGTTFQSVDNATELAAVDHTAVIFVRVTTAFNGNPVGAVLVYIEGGWTSVLLSQVVNAESGLPAVDENILNLVAIDLIGNIYSLVKQFRGSVAASGTTNEYAPTNLIGAYNSPPSPAHLDQFFYNISDGQWYIGEGHFGGIFWFAVSFNRVTGDGEDIWLGQHNTLQDFYNHVDPSTFGADKIFGYIRNPAQGDPNLVRLVSFTAGTDSVTSYSWKRSGADETERIAILENSNFLSDTEIQALIDASDGDKVEEDDAGTTTITGTGAIDDPKKIAVTHPYSERDEDLLHDIGARPDWHPQAHDLQRTGTQYDYEFWYQGEKRWINKALQFENEVYVLNDSGLIGENPETENLDLGESPLHTFTRNAGNIYAIHRSNRDFYAFRASDGQRFGVISYSQEIIDIDIEEDEPTEMFTIEKMNNNSIRVWNYAVSNTPEGNVPGASSFLFDHEFFDLTRSAINSILSANGLSELSVVSHNFSTGETITYAGVVSISKRNDHLYIGITGLSEINGRAGTAIIRIEITGSKNSISYALDTNYCVKLNIPDQVNKIIATADGFIVSLEQAIDEYHRGGFGFLDLVDTPDIYEMMQAGYVLALNDTNDGITFIPRSEVAGAVPTIDQILVPDSARDTNIPDTAINLLLALEALNTLAIGMGGGGLTETQVNALITAALTADTHRDFINGLITTALTNYSTTADITTAINNAIVDFVTSDVVDTRISNAITTALADYTDTTDTNAAIAAAITTALADYSTTTQVTAAIAAALTTYSTTTDINAAIAAAVSDFVTSTVIDTRITAATADFLTMSEIETLVDNVAGAGDEVRADAGGTITIEGTGTTADPKIISVTRPFSERDQDLLEDIGARGDWHPSDHDLQKTGTQYENEFWYQNVQRRFNKSLRYSDEIYVLNDAGLVGSDPATEDLNLNVAGLEAFARNAGNIYAYHRDNNDIYFFNVNSGVQTNVLAGTQTFIDLEIEEANPTELFFLERLNNNAIRIVEVNVSNIAGETTFAAQTDIEISRTQINSILTANGLSSLPIINRSESSGATTVYVGVVSVSKREGYLYLGITGLSEINGRAGSAVIRVATSGTGLARTYTLDSNYCIKFNIGDEINKVIATADGFIISESWIVSEYHRGGFGFLDLVDTPDVYEMMEQGWTLALNNTGDGLTFIPPGDAKVEFWGVDQTEQLGPYRHYFPSDFTGSRNARFLFDPTARKTEHGGEDIDLTFLANADIPADADLIIANEGMIDAVNAFFTIDTPGKYRLIFKCFTTTSADTRFAVRLSRVESGSDFILDQQSSGYGGSTHRDLTIPESVTPDSGTLIGQTPDLRIDYIESTGSEVFYITLISFDNSNESRVAGFMQLEKRV